MKRLRDFEAPLPPVHGLRQQIVESWNRCRAAGLHPSKIRARKVAETDLARRLEQNRLLIEIAQSHLHHLAITMAGSPHSACLTDADGIVLAAVTSGPANKPAALLPGADWSETAIGTNGAGTALAANQPVAIVRMEHYASAWAEWTCTGAPLHATDGSLIGAIDASTTDHEDCYERLQLVVEAARKIESEHARRLLAVSSEDKRPVSVGLIAHLCELGHAMVRDLDGTIRLWGAQNLYGWSSGEAARRLSHELLKTQFPRPLEEINQILLRQGFWTGELGHTTKAGGRITVLSYWALLHDKEGSVGGVVETSIDVTALRTACQTLYESDRHKDEFLSILAHEIRNPLGAIIAARDLLEPDRKKDPRQRNALAIIERQVSHLSRLTDDLIDLQQISKGKLDYRPEPIQLSAIIRGAIEIAQPKIDAQRHKLAVSMPQDEIQLSGDRVRLIQAISNLLDNAAKYTPEGGSIFLKAEIDEDHVVIEVRDNGIGVPPELLPGIFELYSRSARQGEKSFKGLGVGLALVRSIVHMHGGEVEAFSKGLGQGSDFVVRLPISGKPQSAG